MGDPLNVLQRNCDIPSQPIINPVWRGSFSICNEKFSIVPGLAAHLSNKTCLEVSRVAHLLPSVLRFQFLPRHDMWPKSFSRSPPTGNNIALYFFPEYKSDEPIYKSLLDCIISQDFAMKAMVGNIELLVFVSLQLPPQHHRFQGKYYMWGVFKGKLPSPPHQLDDYLLAENRSFECDVPLTPANDAGTRKDVCDTESPLGFLNNNDKANSQRIKRINSKLTISRGSNIILGQCKKRMVDTFPTTSPVYPKRKIASAKGLQSGSPRQESDTKLSKRGRSLDVGWEHAVRLEGRKNGMICKYCTQVILRGRISRLKEHLAGGGPKACPNVPLEVQEEMKRALEMRDMKRVKLAAEIILIREALLEANESRVRIENRTKSISEEDAGAEFSGNTAQSSGAIQDEMSCENTGTTRNTVVDIMLKEITNGAIMNFMNEEMLEHHVTIPKPVQSENQPSLTEPLPLGNQITPPVPLLPIQQFSEQPKGARTGPQAVLSEGMPDNTIVPPAILFATSMFTTSASDVQETTAFESQDVLPDIMPQDDNGEGENRSSHTQGGSQSIGTSILHMVSDFDESVSLDETGSVDSSAEQVDKYSVKPSLAPMLQAIIEKHGDIAQNWPLVSKMMLTPALERVCIAVQDLKAVQFTDLQVCHLESLYSAIIDAELVNLDVEWLRNQHDDLMEAMDMINHCKNLNDDRVKIIKDIEYMKKILDLKRDEMMKLQSEIHSLESDCAAIEADTRNLKSTMDNIKSELKALAHESLMNELV